MKRSFISIVMNEVPFLDDMLFMSDLMMMIISFDNVNFTVVSVLTCYAGFQNCKR
jgi:hypothetical protein